MAWQDMVGQGKARHGRTGQWVLLFYEFDTHD